MSLKSMLAFIAKYLLGIAHMGDYIFVYLCICVFLREVIIRMQHQVIKEQVDQDVARFTNPLAAVRNMSNQDANAVADSKLTPKNTNTRNTYSK